VAASPQVRRRRLTVLALAAVAAVAGAVVGAGAGDDSSAVVAPGFCDEPGRPALERAAGQLVMVRMEGSATPELLERARAGEIGGVILFPPSDIAGERLAGEIERVQRAAGRGGFPPLLVAIDQEGGIVERLPALPPQVSPFTIAQNDDRRAAALEGEATGFQLRELGIDVNLAPVLDVPASDQQFMAPRAFGSDSDQVARLGLAFASGMRREAVAATAKHFPGLGRAVENTDFAPTTVAASRRELRSDIEPFTAASARGIDLIMLSSAAYPALGARGPAVLSPAIATGLLRDELGFKGVSVSDDLLAPAIGSEYSARRAGVLAAAAGVDLLLFAARDVSGIPGALVSAVESGRLEEAMVRASCARVVSLKERLRSGEPLE
jgi:beta-N-acetylhexosaminidase